MEWFRFYDRVLDDEKVQQLPDRLFKIWVNLLCLANRGTPRGALPSSLAAIAFSLRMTPAHTEKALKELDARGLFDFPDGIRKPHNWDGRQFKSDDVTLRTSAYKQRNSRASYSTAAGTSQQTHVVAVQGTFPGTFTGTPPDPDTESDTDSDHLPPTPLPDPQAAAPPENGGGRESRAITKQQSARASTKTTVEEPAEFRRLWEAYPTRDGVKGSRNAALAVFIAKPPGEFERMVRAAEIYAVVCGPNGEHRKPRDAGNFLADDSFWQSMLDIDPAQIRAVEKVNGNAKPGSDADNRRAIRAAREARRVGPAAEPGLRQREPPDAGGGGLGGEGGSVPGHAGGGPDRGAGNVISASYRNA